MEINLELPSCEHEKLDHLDVGTTTKDDAVDTANDLHVQVDNIDPYTRTQHIKEVDGANISENVTSGGDRMDMDNNWVDFVDKRSSSEPQNGLEFESKEAAYSFYQEYARSVGFGITIKASRRSKKSGKFIDIKIACSRFGSKRESTTTVNPRSCIKTDCKAGMHIKKTPDEKWTIYSFVKEHNHEICPDDCFRGRDKQQDTGACQENGLQLALDESDIQVMNEYFICMQDENPNFFYAIDLDHDRRLRSIFWIDSKGRHDYRNFHDVVVFDTFYVKSKCKIPFVPIVGVNHHFQYILLGCALVGEETSTTYVRLMRTWLKAVGSQAPKVMITDQDNILKEAVADVFPDTRHCFCLWHILGKVPENLGYVINQNGDFMGKFSKCIFQSWSDEQFEKRWWKLISKFELKEDEWVQLLYKDRKNWIPTYMQDLFLAGMSTTERAGSITSYFDKYLLKETTFKEFIEGYKVFIAESYDMETEADFETRQQPSLISLSPFEKQMATVYTDSIFKKFQVEILGVVSCRLHKEREDVSSVIFQVDDFEERQKFLVAWNETELDVCCLCRSFEYRGILCRHAILVIQMSGLSSIPSHYILRRWTKDAKVSQTVGDITNVLPNRLQRFNDLCRRAITLSEVGSLSQDTYKVAFQALKKVYKHCVSVNDSARTVLEPNMSTFHGFLDVAEANHGSHMAKSTKKRKTYKKKPLSEPEKITVRTQDSFQQMEHMTSRAHNLDDCYIPQQDIPAVELGSRAPTFDGYYGAQQSLQGEGQLNSISLVRDGYYSNQQAIQGLGQLHPLRTRIPHYGMQQSMQGLLQGQHCFRAPVTHGFYDIQDNLEDMEQSVESSQNRSLAPKHLHDKSLAQ